MPGQKAYDDFERDALFSILSETEKLAHVGGWEWDIVQDVWTFSDNWLNIHGCTDRHLTTSELLSIAHPDDRQEIQEALDSAVAEVTQYEIEHRIIRQDTGEERHIKARGIPGTDGTGKAVRIYGSAQDITEQKKSEEKLRKSNEMFMRTEAIARVGSWEWNIADDTVTWSTQLYRIFQLDPAIEAPNWAEHSKLYHPEDFKTLRRAVETAIENAEPYEIELRAFRIDGETRICRATGFPETGEEGQVVRLFGMLQDITDQKQTEEELHQTHSLLQQIVDNSLSLIIVKDSDGRYILANNISARLLGHTKEEMFGQTDFDLFPEETAKRLSRNDKHVFETEEAIKSEEQFQINGRDYTFTTTKFPLYDADNRVFALCGMATDITERLETEMKLRENERRYKSAQRIGKVGNWEYDIENDTFWGSEQAKEIYGFDPQSESFTTDQVENCIPERERVHRALNELIREGRPYNLEFEIHPLSGPETKTIKSIAEILLDDSGAPQKVVGVIQDITSQKQMERQLLQSQKHKSLANLAGGIAHEFNNILSIIIGNNELILEDLPEWSLSRQSSEEIRLAGLRARDIVKHLLTISRQDDSTKKPIDVASVVKQSLKLIRSTTPTNIGIRDKIAQDCLPVMGDATQINQILINLCNNAIDAVPISGGIIDVELCNSDIDQHDDETAHEPAAGRYIKLQVTDNGSGISPDIIDRIFEPYFTTKDFGEGSGIGLAVVHGIVENHGGSINCQSTEGRGTTFTIMIPAYEGAVEEEPPLKALLSGNGERILFVDDEPSIAKLGRRHLESLGYEVYSTTDPLEALEMIKTEPDRFDLIISDMAMPKIPGDQLISEILSLYPQMPTMICSGYSSRMSEEKALEMGIKAFLMKPFDKRDLAEKIKDVLYAREREKDNSYGKTNC